MKKLSLNPEQLRVESFSTPAPPAVAGTVAAHGATVIGCPTRVPQCGTVLRGQSCAATCTEPDICPVF